MPAEQLTLDGTRDRTVALTADHRAFLVRFPVDPQLNTAVRNIPGTWWNKNERAWQVPAVRADHLAPVIRGKGFYPTTDAKPLLVAHKDKPVPAFDDGSPQDGDGDPPLPTAATPRDADPPTKEEIREAVREADRLAALATTASRALDADIVIPGLNPAMKAKPFQRAGIAYAVSKRRTFLADEVGLGKTLMALGTVAVANAYPAVIVCQKSLKLNWKAEVAKWFPGRTVTVVDGRTPGPIEPADFIVVNYDILSDITPKKKKGEPPKPMSPGRWRDVTALEPMTLIVDESHRVKTSTAGRTKAVKNISKVVRANEGLVLLLSATPMLNRPVEYVAQLEILGRLGEFGGWEKFVRTFCLPPDAPILMGDFTEKPIAEVEPGDEVVGWSRGVDGSRHRRLVKATVNKVLMKTAPLQRVTLTDGTELVCTPDHKWLNGYTTGASKDRSYEYVEARAGDLNRIGTRVGPSSIVRIKDDTSPQFIHDTDYDLGYIHGFFRGDGWCARYEKRKIELFRSAEYNGIDHHNIGAACSDWEPIQRLMRGLDYFDVPFTQRDEITKSDKVMHRVECNHSTAWDFFSSPQPDSDAWWAGFLGGIYDAEGSSQVIAQYESHNPDTWAMIEKALQRFDLEYHPAPDRKTIRLKGGRPEFFRFWRIASPALNRKLEEYAFTRGGKFMTSKAHVASIKPLPGEHVVYTLETTTGNYVAYGCGSKNCNGYKKYGRWETKGSSNEVQLHTLLREKCYVRRLKTDVMPELPAVEFEQVVLPLSPKGAKEYAKAEEDIVRYLVEKAAAIAKELGLNPKSEAVKARMRAQSNEELVRLATLRRLAAQAKLPAAIEWIESFLEDGEADNEKIVVFAHHQEVQDALIEKFGALHILAANRQKMEHAEEMKRLFQESDDPKHRVIVCSTAAKEGHTLTRSSNVCLVEPVWVPGDEIQMVGRVWGRLNDPHGATFWRLIGDETVDLRMVDLVAKKAEIVDAVNDGKPLPESANESVAGDLVLGLAYGDDG